MYSDFHLITNTGCKINTSTTNKQVVIFSTLVLLLLFVACIVLCVIFGIFVNGNTYHQALRRFIELSFPTKFRYLLSKSIKLWQSIGCNVGDLLSWDGICCYYLDVLWLQALSEQ